MCSNRITKYESFNNQNCTGWHQNLGMTYLYIPGCTYNNYFNSISPYYLPGVTCSNNARDIKDSTQVLFNYDKADVDKLRAGSCTIDNNLFSMFYMIDNGVEAKKSYFIYDDFIVHLGTDIKGDRVNTTLYSKVTENKIIKAENRFYIPDYGTIISNDKVEKFNYNNSTILYIDHSINKQYEYVLVPLQDVKEKYVYNKVNTINTSAIQGIYNNEIMMLNFWKAGKIEINNQEIEVDNISQVGIKIENNKYIISVNDITQELGKITLTLSDKFIGFAGTNIKYKTKDGKDYTELSINCKDLIGKNILLTLIK